MTLYSTLLCKSDAPGGENRWYIATVYMDYYK